MTFVVNVYTNTHTPHYMLLSQKSLLLPYLASFLLKEEALHPQQTTTLLPLTSIFQCPSRSQTISVKACLDPLSHTSINCRTTPQSRVPGTIASGVLPPALDMPHTLLPLSPFTCHDPLLLSSLHLPSLPSRQHPLQAPGTIYSQH